MLRPCHASQGTDVVARLLDAPEEVSMDARVSYPRTGSQLAFARVATALAFVFVRALAIGALAVGRMAVGALAIRQGRIERLFIDQLDVRRLHFRS